MKKLLLIYLFIYPSICNSQLVSFVSINDSVYAVDPTTGITKQINKFFNTSAKHDLSDSVRYLTKYRSDTARNNIYALAATKQASGNYLTANQNITLSGDISGSGQTAITTAIGSGKVTNAMLAGSIDLTTKVTGILPFANNAGTSAATSATTGTMTVNMTTKIITITPSGACTFNGSGGVTGQTSTFVITTSGVSSFVLTWNTNYRTTGTLATGTTTAKIFAVTFLCTNGTQWIEISRTAAM